MRHVSLLFAVLFVVPLLGSDSSKEYDDKTEAFGIEGTWRLTEHRINAEPRNPFYYDVSTFRSGTYTINFSNGDVWQGSYRIDPARKPPQLDWAPSGGYFKGETLKFIYQVEGDTLRIAGQRDKQRPPGFDAEHVEVWTYKRVKK